MANLKNNEEDDFGEEDEEYTLVTVLDEESEEINFTSNARTTWTIDSGASTHICREKSKFMKMKSTNKIVSIADGVKIPAKGIGDVRCTLELSTESTKSVTVVIKDVLFIPEFERNLLSVKKLAENGHSVVLHADGGKLTLRGMKDQVIPIDCINKLYIIHESRNPPAVAKKPKESFTTSSSISSTSASAKTNFPAEISDNLLLAHVRLGHADFKMMQELKGCVHGLFFRNHNKFIFCDVCAKSKMAKLPFQPSKNRADTPLQLVHSDVEGPMQTPSVGGQERFAISFLDDKSRLLRLYLMKTKDESLEKLMLYVAEVVNQSKFKLLTLRSDNGGEYISSAFRSYCLSQGIKQEFTVPHSPEQNGVAERAWRTTNNMVRSMLAESNLPNEFWGPATLAAAYIKNRVLHSANKDGRTPYEIMFGEKPDLSNIRVFGCPVFFKNTNPDMKKLDPRGIKGIFAGYSERSKGYIIWVPSTKKFKLSHSVKFIEEIKSNHFHGTGLKNPPPQVNEDESDEEVPLQQAKKRKEPTTSPEIREFASSPDSETVVDGMRFRESSSEPTTTDTTTTNIITTANPTPPVSTTAKITTSNQSSISSSEIRRSTRSRPPSLKCIENASIASEEDENTEDLEFAFNLGMPTSPPSSPQEALQDPEWKKAMETEIQALQKNKTWILVKPPPGRLLVDCKWIFKSKEDEKGNEVKKKARLVARGFSQKYGIDYEETYSPVMKMSTLRLLLAIACTKSYKVKYADFEAAYLQSDMNEEIYMRQPVGFEKNDLEGKPYACLLKKSLYGLKQSGRNWNLRINKWLLDNGFTRSKYDTCLYLAKKKKGFLVVLLYVDDMIRITSDSETWDDLLKKMQTELKVNNLGDAKWILGMLISQDQRGISIDQSKYVKSLLEKHKMDTSTPVKTPMVPVSESHSELEEEARTESTPEIRETYLKIVGGLIYASTISRPDISYAISKLGENMSKPSEMDITKAYRVLKYLRGTQDYKINFHRDDQTELVGYTDSDWAGDHTNRRSTSGYLFVLGGAAISWQSKRQETVALSSAEAEYVALATATQEAIFLRGILEDIGYLPSQPTKIFVDNQSCIKIAVNQVTRNRTKHIAAKYHFTRERIELKEIILEFKPTNQMAADCLTKAVGANILKRTNAVMFGTPETEDKDQH